jgi:hypothetical protein
MNHKAFFCQNIALNILWWNKGVVEFIQPLCLLIVSTLGLYITAARHMSKHVIEQTTQLSQHTGLTSPVILPTHHYCLLANYSPTDSTGLSHIEFYFFYKNCLLLACISGSIIPDFYPKAAQLWYFAQLLVFWPIRSELGCLCILGALRLHCKVLNN